MAIMNSDKLNDEQRAWAKESYARFLNKADTEGTSKTDSVTWFLRATFTLTWVGLLASIYSSELPLLVERMVAFGVWWVVVVETISVIIATIGLVAIFFIRAALEKDSDRKSVDELYSGMLTIEKPISLGFLLSWGNNFMLVVMLALAGWTPAAVWMALVTCAVFFFYLVIRSIVLDYYTGLSNIAINYLRKQYVPESDKFSEYLQQNLGNEN